MYADVHSSAHLQVTAIYKEKCVPAPSWKRIVAAMKELLTVKRAWAEIFACAVVAALLPANLRAQQGSVLPAVQASMQPASGASAPGPATAMPITLEDAMARARALSPTLQAALANAGIAAEAVTQARAANLPTISANTQYLYTEGNGTAAARYIANNGVHEYIAQGVAHQTFSAALLIDHRRSALLAAVARDQAAIAQRGLVVTVVQSYAGLVAANGKLQAADQELDAAQTFLQVTQQLEQGGEVAHADVVKAQIQVDDSKVGAGSAQLAREQARLELALLIFPDIHQPFRVSDDPAQMLQLPAFTEAEARAREANPDLDAAQDTERAAKKEVASARAGYLPTVTFDAFYGIDANQFAARTFTSTGPIDNLGYSGLLSLNLPIFNWGATHSLVKQAEYRQHQAATELSYAQRTLNADLEQFYLAAQEAKSEMELRQRAAADAQQSRDLTLLQYKAGMNTALEVVNAESTLSVEQTAYYDAESRYAVALANLATLTGSLHP
jgi:outer membrane protein TolC